MAAGHRTPNPVAEEVLFPYQKAIQHQLRNWPTHPAKHYVLQNPWLEGHSSPALGRLNVSSFEVIAWGWGRHPDGESAMERGLNPFLERPVFWNFAGCSLAYHKWTIPKVTCARLAAKTTVGSVLPPAPLPSCLVAWEGPNQRSLIGWGIFCSLELWSQYHRIVELGCQQF